MIFLEGALKFNPIFKEKVWGGDKLKTFLGKPVPSDHTGESWELSGLEGDISVVSDGPEKGRGLDELIRQYGGRLLGKKVFSGYGGEFPLLIKFIDARQDLSVQLHPNNDLSAKRHGARGKTEMWYVLHADEGTGLYLGFEGPMDREKYVAHLEAGTLAETLHFRPVSAGDAFLIPTGTVHAIGGGVLLAEIQQASDITYRIYDWDRPDEEGNFRQLHTELALDAIDFNPKPAYQLPYPSDAPEAKLVTTPYFTVNILQPKAQICRDLSHIHSFVVYMCMAGRAFIRTESGEVTIRTGETVLVPACRDGIEIIPDKARLLETYIA